MSYLKRIIYNCKKATLLIEKNELGRISVREHIELRIHLFGCSFCRIYKKQSQAITEMVKKLFRLPEQPAIPLDDDFKMELQERIEDILKRGN